MNKSMMEGIRASSEPYALLKARVIREHLVADWGLSESGAAGPTGNKYGDKAGHCVLAVAGGIWASRSQTTDRVSGTSATGKAAMPIRRFTRPALYSEVWIAATGISAVTPLIFHGEFS